MKPANHHITLHFLLIVALFLNAGVVTAQDTTEPQRITLMEFAIKERPLLAQLLTTAGLAPALSGNTPYTLLAPPEATLQNLKGQSAEKIRTTLALHVIKGKHREADLKDGGKLETYGGAQVNICRKKDQTLINGVKVTAANKEVRNGIVHELNSPLVQ